MTLRPSYIVLVLANLFPLAGVFLLDWQVIDILLLYWAENVVIGIVNVLRMAVRRTAKRLFLIPFFCVHYGMFCFGHLSAVIALFGDEEGIAANWQALFVSHLFSFFSNFIGRGEYGRTDIQALMQRPYGRIIALHVAIIIGAALVDWLGSPVMMLVVLVVAKIAMDLRLHVSERRKFSDLAETL